MGYSPGMSSLWARRTLWLLLLLTVPVPMWFLGLGRAPTLALFEISIYLIPVWLEEGGPGGELALMAFGAQAVLWALALYFVARVLVRILGGASSGQVPVLGVAVISVALLVLSLFPVYVTPVIARGAPVNIFSVY